MLSYRHAFHAGNHADILKHLTLTLILKALLGKDKPFTVFDTHAGAGLYQLDDARLSRTGEAKDGIRRLLRAAEDGSTPDALMPYLNLCREYAGKGLYPGSPEIERSMMRGRDRLFVAELHGTEVQILEGNMAVPPLCAPPETPSVTVRHCDGLEMLKSHLPPAVRRGLILTDPSYELDSDYTGTAAALTAAMRKWNTAILALWYPLLAHRRAELSLLKDGLGSAAERLFWRRDEPFVQAELHVAPPQAEGAPRLYGSGMMVINPPYLLSRQLRESLPWLAKILAGERGGWSVGGAAHAAPGGQAAANIRAEKTDVAKNTPSFS